MPTKLDIQQLPNSIVPDGVLTGLAVSISALNLAVAIGTWRIAGIVYSITSPVAISVAASDPIDNRIDLVYANTSNQVLLLAGTAAPNPVKPSPPSNCIEIGFALVTPTGTSAGSSAVADYVTNAVFSDVIGEISDLVTDDKSSVVNAVNEISEDLAGLQQDNVILKIFKKSNYS